MTPFKRYKQFKSVLSKLLKSEARVKLSDLLMFLIIHLIICAVIIDCAFESGAL
jgi:hypothetical protein